MSKRDRCQALWVPVIGLMLCGLIASQSPVVASAEGPRTGHVPNGTASQIQVSARVVRGPEPLMQEFLNTLPLSPIQVGGPNSGVVQAGGSKPESKEGKRRGFPFQQAVLSKKQVAEFVRRTEKHKSLSTATISPVTILEGVPEEIELLKGKIADTPPMSSNEIGHASGQQASEGIKLRLTSLREADQTLLKCDWDSREFVSLKKFAFADENGKKVVKNLPGSIKVAHFRMESAVPDGQTLVVSGFTRNGGTKKAEAIVLLLDVAPVRNP